MDDATAVCLKFNEGCFGIIKFSNDSWQVRILKVDSENRRVLVLKQEQDYYEIYFELPFDKIYGFNPSRSR